jgi:rhodanese-related sulfurtransferase
MIVQCRTGVRSADVIRELKKHGFKKLLNLEGGINRWAREVDPSIPIY